jgi:hypothetical protein
VASWPSVIRSSPDLSYCLKPYDETQLDAEKFQAMKAFKSPFGKLHLYTAYTLLGMLLMHIAAVIVSDKREGGASPVKST